MPRANGLRKLHNCPRGQISYNDLVNTFRSNFEYMPWYAGKAEIRQYLYELNTDKEASRNPKQSLAG